MTAGDRSATPVHAGLVALRVGGAWRGALLQGPSGVGKSDLTIRALAQGFRLVADDRVELFASGGRLWGVAPRPLAGLMEVRGLGVVRAPVLRPLCEVALTVDLLDPASLAERCPDPAQVRLCGLQTPLIALHPLEASAPAKLALALQGLSRGP